MADAQSNPFAAPAAATSGVPGERLDFQDLPTKDVKKLYYRSSNVGAIGVLCLIGASVLVSMPLWLGAAQRSGPVPMFVFPVIGVLELVVGIGCFVRPGWVRVAGIVVCALMLLNLGLGTIIGIIGIIAFAAGKPLFGPHRVKHSALKAEVRYRKRNRVA